MRVRNGSRERRGGACVVVVSALVLQVVAGCGPTLPEERDAVFALAVEASLSEDAELAIMASHRYLAGASRDDPRYDRALRLKARGAEQLGLSYAASMWYLDIAQARLDVELAGDAVRALEALLARYPHDEATLISGFLATEEVTGLPTAQQAFVDYLQGLDSLRRGLDGWARKRFDNIPETSPYHARARYVLAVKDLAQGGREAVQAELEELLETELPEDLLEDVLRTQARIAFEERRYDDALDAYELLRASAPDDPGLLLEMAWSHYYRGESRRALGLLVALDAPAYRELIAPERFLLEALALRRLCQFEPARRAAVRLRDRHGDALADLYEGVALSESAALRGAARLRTSGMGVARFRQRVELEAELVQDLADDLGPEVTASLTALYARGTAEAKRLEDELLVSDLQAVSEELLSAEEGVRLILHELGVALLRGRRRPEGAEEAEITQTLTAEENVLYRFEGEFWTDELDDLVVTIEDRCID